ncbi:MAG TPA: rod shape-determining protein MreC [Terracidiphilus sp.]|jgi:rod shape-determining protein MreC|nr:rod shape-determining protein MreC [Terracidiphilus sp.]
MESFFTRYRNLVVLTALLVAQIIGLAMQVRRTGSGRNVYDPADSAGVRLIRLWANALVSPPERVSQFFTTGVGQVWGDYFELGHIRQQNKDLQQTIDRLRLEQAALLEDARQGQRLQAMLGFEEKYPYATLPAQVLGTSGSDQSRLFTIDKGKDDGLRRDMAVVSPEGIVGKVREVFGHSAQVLEINDQSSGAGVILVNERIRGILRGNAAGQPQIVGILADNRIQPGEKVLTAGGDQIFPRGLPVGVVEKVERDPDRDGFIHVIVKPDLDLDRLDEVLVITSIEPRFSDQQLKDMALSQQLKGPDASELDEQQKASQIMAERLPGITDPNAPQTLAKPADGSAPPATPPQAVVPKLLPPARPDRFVPGNAPSPEQSAEPESPEQATPKARKPATPRPQSAIPKQEPAPGREQPGTKPAPKPASRPANPQPQGVR